MTKVTLVLVELKENVVEEHLAKQLFLESSNEREKYIRRLSQTVEDPHYKQ